MPDKTAELKRGGLRPVICFGLHFRTLVLFIIALCFFLEEPRGGSSPLSFIDYFATYFQQS